MAGLYPKTKKGFEKEGEKALIVTLSRVGKIVG
jgi:hypothetical protein